MIFLTFDENDETFDERQHTKSYPWAFKKSIVFTLLLGSNKKIAPHISI